MTDTNPALTTSDTPPTLNTASATPTPAEVLDTSGPQETPTIPVVLTTTEGQHVVRWSELLSHVPEAQRMHLLSDLPAALDADIIIGVLLRERVMIPYRSMTGRSVRHRGHEALIVIPPDPAAMDHWIADKRAEAIYAMVRSQPAYTVTLSDVLDLQLDVARLHDMSKEARRTLGAASPARTGRRSRKSRKPRTPAAPAKTQG